MYDRNSSLRHRYGISEQEFNWLLRAQDGVCAICRDKPGTSVDHDHGHCPGIRGCRECIRGILCRGCNTRLGWFEGGNRDRLTVAVPEKEWAEAAMDYLTPVGAEA